MSIWQCPQGEEFIEEISDHLTDGTHCVVSLPKPRVKGFLSAFQMYAERMLGGTKSVFWDGRQILAESLSTAFCEVHNWTDLPSYNLMDGKQHLVLVVHDMLPDARKEEFLQFLTYMKAHAHALRDKKEYTKWSLLAIVPLGSLPENDMDLCALRWWGRLRPSDLEYAIEQNLYPHLNSIDYADACWFIAICKGLAASDPDIVDTLFWQLPKNAEQLRKAFDQHPLYSKENSVLAYKYADTAVLMAGRKTPSAKGMKLWGEGIFDLDCHGVPTIHPAALAAANRTTDLEKLAVRGQIMVYLPIVQMVLDFIGHYMSSTFGSDWNKKSNSYKGLEYEIGPLSSYLHAFFEGHIPKELHQLTALWRKLRNFLAHGHMIDNETAIKAVRLFNKMKDSGKYQ